MESKELMVALIGLAIFAWIVAVSRLDTVVTNRRAQAWVGVIFFCISFWSVVAAVIVGVSS
jgi:hypothetical protein